MRYELSLPKDAHGQPLRLFRANQENNISKAIEQLSGICAGILADGVVNEREANFFAEWVQKSAELEPVWPSTEILERVKRIFADGVCNDEEREELKSIMEAICGHKDDSQRVATYSSTLPLDSPLPEPVVFRECVFNITGRFAFGTRRKVMEAIETRGGLATDSTPTRDTHFLVIGVFASRDWANTNYGRKIERAVELREAGSGLRIISEEHWRRFPD